LFHSASSILLIDAPQHLTEVLPTLHTFIMSAGGKLAQEDRKQVYEAVAHVISAMPMERAALSLKTFAADLLALVHALALKQQPASAQEITDVCGEYRSDLVLVPRADRAIRP
jgi:transportin-3